MTDTDPVTIVSINRDSLICDAIERYAQTVMPARSCVTRQHNRRQLAQQRVRMQRDRTPLLRNVVPVELRQLLQCPGFLKREGPGCESNEVAQMRHRIQPFAKI